MNLYYNRPANELIFVTRSMHRKIHYELCANNGKLGCEKLTFEQRSKGGKIGGKKNSIPILQFAKDGTLIKEWPSTNEAGRQLKTSIGNICGCLKGNRKFAGGFVWRYKDRLQ